MEIEGILLENHTVYCPTVVYYRHDVTACIGFGKRTENVYNSPGCVYGGICLVDWYSYFT